MDLSDDEITTNVPMVNAGSTLGSGPLWRWLKRLDPFYERPSLVRQNSPIRRFLYPYVVVAGVCCVYFVYAANSATNPQHSDNEPAPSINLDSVKRTEPAVSEASSSAKLHMHPTSYIEPAKKSFFTLIRDIGVEGGAKDQFAVNVNTDVAIKTILLWNTFFNERDYIPPFEKICPGYPCRVTMNRTEQADAIIVHLRDINATDVPKRQSRDEVFVLLNAEAPPHAPPLPESFNNLFNWTITYRQDADIPLTKNVISKYEFMPIKKDFHVNKTKLATWFVSHCQTSSERETLVAELAKYGVHTDIVGDCGTIKCDRSSPCYDQFSKDHLFYLSFENSICNDYITEKLFNILEHSEMVPIVLGGADYSRFAPPGSYINVNKFSSIKQLANYIQHVSNDPVLYNSYHRWRSYYQLQDPLHFACRLCAKLHTNYRRRMYQDFNTYWHSNTCHGSWRKAYDLR
ncbi:alpha-(1,3)-fucosyltransferase C-like [Varroa jacobsoni]|uniref:Fucosyltransferase n=1 Tax=Varroa destructor TaxID=109461 RepID=A0A7M7JE52_VARDE|nr:alpha-(1,3)-fucosyltransferase C-like isoform X2 [Varroa destructor]XP_022708575.1 alpha-(1,3)-fucosyltransferase C-like [Varroa jacobsoni]